MKISSYLASTFLGLGILNAQDYTEDIAGKHHGPEELPKKKFSLFDEDDGYLDIGAFLDKPFGFYPVIAPITEPAVGYGAAVVPVFIHRPEGQARPNFYALGGLMTENGSEGLFAAYSAYHFDERVQVEAAVFDASFNLDFYGSGTSVIPSDLALQYNLDVTGFTLGGEWKIRDQSPWTLGLKYFYGDVNASLKRFPGSEFLPPEVDLSALGFKTTFSTITTGIAYDTRDNVFTPTNGQLTELEVGWSDPSWGASDHFQLLTLQTLQFIPLIDEKLYFSARGAVTQSFGDVPFYRLPFVELRGVPMVRYQGDGAANLEAELRWQIHERWSLLGFSGVGMAWNDSKFFGGSTEIIAGGAGFRYLISKRHGMHVGIDAGFSEDTSAVYIQFGSAWPRS
ncbi:BamA/TamA family outer membrane protein [Rubritalea marina]|uniref:BamA/TamA family outer membrane protein n=1 Tax=Rubritalea marina TaxID=361055 RepID=UPI00035FCCD7|nr:BamA/TamA family outer membrane protein [Rubritalea marina]